MTESLKIKVDFDGETTQALLDFIESAQEGKFTERKPPILVPRIEIQELDKSIYLDDNCDDSLLFGISY